MFEKHIYGLKDSNDNYVNFDYWDLELRIVKGEKIFSYQLWSENEMYEHLEELNSKLENVDVEESIVLPVKVVKFKVSITEVDQ